MPKDPTIDFFTPCQKAFHEWCNLHGKWPDYTREVIWEAAWNAAIAEAEKVLEKHLKKGDVEDPISES